jgi:two-component system, cell cycle sensor histidine kinase and response regulator CckA
MPGMSGAKLASVLTAQHPEMRVFFVSGYAESTVLRHGNVDVGARLLQKPFSLRAMGALAKSAGIASAPAISVSAAGAAR